MEPSHKTAGEEVATNDRKTTGFSKIISLKKVSQENYLETPSIKYTRGHNNIDHANTGLNLPSPNLMASHGTNCENSLKRLLPKAVWWLHKRAGRCSPIIQA